MEMLFPRFFCIIQFKSMVSYKRRCIRVIGPAGSIRRGQQHTERGFDCLLCRRGKAFFKIGEDVVDMLGADGEADGVGLDIRRFQLLCA